MTFKRAILVVQRQFARWSIGLTSIGVFMVANAVENELAFWLGLVLFLSGVIVFTLMCLTDFGFQVRTDYIKAFRK